MVDFLFMDDPVIDEASWSKAMTADWAGPLLDEVITSFADVGWDGQTLKDDVERIGAAAGVTAASRRRRCASPSPDARSGRRCTTRSRSSAATRRSGGCGPPVSGWVRSAVSVRADDTPVALIRPIPDDRPTRRRRVRVRRRRAPRPLRWAVRIVALLVVVGVGYFAVSLFQVWSTGRTTRPARSTPSSSWAPPSTTACRHPSWRPGSTTSSTCGRRVWRPWSWRPGGNRPGDRFTEAEASAAYLTDRGVPADAILLEDQGTSSYESLRGVPSCCEQRGLDDVLIVTDPYHSLRSRLIAEQFGLRAHVSPTTTSVVTGGDLARHQLQEAAGVAIGRLIGFQHI